MNGGCHFEWMSTLFYITFLEDILGNIDANTCFWQMTSLKFPNTKNILYYNLILEQSSICRHIYSWDKPDRVCGYHWKFFLWNKLFCKGQWLFKFILRNSDLPQGHLSPDAGFIYNVEQDATYYFVNVAPQFQSFNNGNWKSLEINTRDLARALTRAMWQIYKQICIEVNLVPYGGVTTF